MTTIKDVAREAGVSVATVSRVFNHSAVVSDETRENVRAVAERLNYWPNAAARSLITNRTHSIGALLPDLFGEFYSEILRGMDMTARQSGLHLLVSSSHAHAEEMIAALRTMRGRIDGLIAMAPDIEAGDAFRGIGADLPMVLIDPGKGFEGCDTITIANQSGAAAIVKHLAGIGHRLVATVTGPARNADARQRLEGYRAAMRAVGEQPAGYEIEGDFTEPSGYAAAMRLLALETRPTAVFAANDYLAIGILGAFSDAGVRVPEDIAVVGFDDIAMARYLNPPLTTVHVDAYRLGERAVGMLLDRSRRGGGRPRHEVLPTTLVVRSSCGSSSAQQSRGGTERQRGR